MVGVSLSDVVVRYPVYSSGRQRSILSATANRVSFGRVAQDAGQIPTVTALNGISLELTEGMRLALIGRNGSGKTTFLKMCAGLVLPNEGTIRINGTRAAVINPSAGLDPDKTGLENIEYIGRLLGVSRAARRLLVEDVADFTELGDFLNFPIRTYSSGMIVDEIIGAGDALFMEKAANRVRSMFSRAKILILATHAGDVASQLCTSALWLNSGKAVMAGTPEEVWDAYLHQRAPLGAVA
jgi:ABC-type polysaccharide/polyol phosphate transport system ATPase subunit